MSTPITAAAVNELRKRTDLPMMECKSALQEAEGDMEKAILILRERFAKVAVKRAANETAEGRIAVFVDAAAEIGAIIDVRCESAPVVKSEQFIALANDLAKQVAFKGPKTVEELVAQPSVANPNQIITDRINEVIGLIRENMKPEKFTRLTGGQFGHYVHHDGSFGVLVQVTSEKPASTELLRDVAAHIGAMNPAFLRIDDVPADILAREKQLATQQVNDDEKNVGKPANILEKIIEGKVKGWCAENALLDQPIANQAKYDKKTVGQLLKSAGIEVKQFVRYKVGEKIYS